MSVNAAKRFKYNAWCSTKITQVPKFTYTWSIENFSQISKSEPLNSKDFKIKGPDESISKWHLRLRFYEETSSYGVFLQSLNEKETTCSYSLSVLKGDKKKVKGFSTIKKKYKLGTDWGFKKFISENEIKEDLLVDDTLTIGKP